MSVAPLAVLVPMLAATLLAATSPVSRRRVAGIVGLVAALATAALCAAPLAQVGRRHARRLVRRLAAAAGAAVGIDFAVDPLGGAFALFVAVLGVAALVMCIEVIQVEDHLFDAIALVFIAAMVGFCLTGDLFNLFVFFELMSVCAYVLVGYEIRARAPLEGSLAFAITNSIGSILLLFGIALLYGRTGALNLAQIGRTLAEGPADGLVVVSYALLAGGLLVKAAAVPFHFWTADAYAVAPTPVGLLLGGAFSELGLFGLARVHWTVFHDVLAADEPRLRAILVGLGVLTGLVGAVMCAAQHHLKRMLAFATIAHVGLFLAGHRPARRGRARRRGRLDRRRRARQGGAVRDGRPAERLLRDGRGGAAARARARAAVGRRAVLRRRARGGVAAAVRAVPRQDARRGRGAEGRLRVAAGGDGRRVGADRRRAAARRPAGVLRRRAPGARGPALGAGTDDDEDADESEEPVANMPALLWGPALVLVAASLAWGLLPGVVDAAGRAAERFVGERRVRRRGPARRAAARRRVAAARPDATGYLYAAASVLGAVGVAAAALAGARERAPRAGLRALEALRALHSGRPGDYAAFTAAGVAVLGGLLAIAVG